MLAHRPHAVRLLAAACLLATAGLARADDVAQPAPAVPDASAQFAGSINANAVYVRSGAGDNWYPTMKLDQGTKVTVVGIKFDYLKIQPPDGSFDYVAKQYITKHGDGTQGRVERNDLNVRAGSSLNDLKTTVVGKLTAGDEVKITGEKDEYYTIVPPANTFLYVKKDFVTPGQRLGGPGAPPLPVATGGATGGDGPVVSVPPTPSTQPASPPAVAITPPSPDVTPPTTQQTANAVDTTQPAAAPESTASAKFDAAESAFADASKQSLAEQPLDNLIASYTALQQDPTTPASLKQSIALRLATLQARSDARTQFVAEQKAQEDARAKQVAMQAERDELQDRIKKNAVTFYAAVGTLRTSSLQQGPGVLYRLTDPQTGRTVVYVRTSNPAYGALIGQFIGVKGTVQTDNAMNLKYVEPTGEDTVEPGKVGTTVSADLAPPSLSTAAKNDMGSMSNP